MNNKVAVVILNWNGKSFLEQFLPSVVKNSSGARVVVADNNSTDNSISFLKDNYPSVELIQLEQNFGFAGGYNNALKQVDSEYYVLLNSDVEVTKNWLTPMLNLLEIDNSIVACQPKIKDFNNKEYFEYAGASGGFIDKYGYPFCRGRIFETLEKDENQYDNVEEIFWASGASLFIRSKEYHSIGGLDEFFFAHMEEIDLCWRLKNQGHKIMVCPSSTVYHVGGGTLNKVKPQKTFLNFRNSLLTLHKNLPKKERFSVIFIRLLLDGIAGFKFLVAGQPTHTWAILRAHFSFYGAISQNKKKRLKNSTPNLTGKINKSIVKEYFLNKCKFYSDLVK
ncbi:MAG: glycosyltransferase family 2 protein [Vicingaceae bacterium]|nr:glycosyltransferase family 2 protein [Vicingaceae bacterium]